MNIENISLKPTQVLEQNQERAKPESSVVAYSELLSTLNKQAEEVERASKVQGSKSQVEIWKKEREKCLEEYRALVDKAIEKYGSEMADTAAAFFLLASGEDADFEKYGRLLLNEMYDEDCNKIDLPEEQIPEFLEWLKKEFLEKRQEYRDSLFSDGNLLDDDPMEGMALFFFATEADLQTGAIETLVRKDNLENMPRLREILMEHIKEGFLDLTACG